MTRSIIALALASISGLVLAAPPFVPTGPVDVTVTNPVLPVEVANADPIPVVSAPPPLWQGTPYIATVIVFGPGCVAFEAIPEGMVLYIQRATASFNVAPGRGGSAALGIVALGGAGQDFLYIPSFASGPVEQVFGVYDGYQGVVEVGQPTSVTPQGCFFASAADDLRGRVIVTGYLVPAN